MFTIRKKFRFETAHRLPSSYSQKCQQIHGHSYVGEIFLESETLNNDGMVMDFGMIKEKIQQIVDAFDHKFILSTADPIMPSVEHLEKHFQMDLGLRIFPYAPTAEMFAKYIYDEMKKLIKTDNVKVKAVRIHETETGWAEYGE